MAPPLKTRLFWTLYSAVDRRPVLQQPIEKVRAASNRRALLLQLPGTWLVTGRPDRRVSIRTSRLDLPDGARLPMRVYRPNDAAVGTPLVVYFHGGGFVSGNARQSEWWCAGIAARTGASVASVEYRLAPEHPFPVPAEDCYAATNRLAENAAKLIVMGDSAGANLAAVVCLMARDRGGPSIAAQVLLYPPIDMARTFASEHENATAPVLHLADHQNAPKLYLAGHDPADPYVSPLRARLDGLPPALIQTAQYDPLRDHGATYAQALEQAGVPVRYTNYSRAVHGFASLPAIADGAAQALDEAAAFVRRALGS